LEKVRAPVGNVSLILPITGNLPPIAEVLVWDRSLFENVVPDLFKSVVIGVVNILKSPVCSQGSDDQKND